MRAYEREFPDRLWLSTLGLAVFAAAVTAHAWTVSLWPHDLWWLVDTETYRAGGQAVRSGVPLYDHGVYGPLLFTYTPFAAVCFVPLTLLSMDVLRPAATFANLALLLAAVWTAWGYLGYRANHGRLAMTLLVGGFAFWLEPVRTTFILGQINLLLLLLVLLDFAPDGRRWPKGVGVGLAAAIKLTPAVFVVYLLVTRRFKAAVVAMASFAATVAIGFVILPKDSAAYWGGVFLDSGRVGGADSTGNQSIAGMLARLAHAHKPPTLLWLALSALTVLAGLALAAWAHHRGEELLAVVLVGVTGLLVSPMSWTHHWVWTIPLLVIGFHLALTRWRWMWAAAAGYWLLMFPWIGPAPKHGGAPPDGITQIKTHHPLRAVVYDNLYVWLAVAIFAAAAWYLAQASRGKTERGHAAPAVEAAEAF